MTGPTRSDTLPLIEVGGVSKRFCRDLSRSLRYGIQDIVREVVPRIGGTDYLRPGEFWGLRDVSFELRAGESLAIVGVNGSGKSTLLKLISGLLKPDVGQITVRGRVAALIELGTGFSQVLTGRENVFANAAVLGMSSAEVNENVEDIIDFSGVREFIDTPLLYYSSGMVMRLAFSVAVHLKPDVLLLDEVLAVGDIAFQRKCLRHIVRYLDSGGSVVFIGHSPHLSQSICQRGILLEHGRMAFVGGITETLDCYLTRLQDGVLQSAAGETDVVGGTDSSLANADPSKGLLKSAAAGEPVVIDYAGVQPLSGDELLVGDEAVLIARYRSHLQMDDMRCAFFVFTADLWVCITVVTSPPLTIVAGNNEVRVRVRLPLVQGQYAVKCAIGRGDTLEPVATLGWENTSPTFRIAGSRDRLRVNLSSLAPLIEVDGVWTLPGGE